MSKLIIYFGLILLACVALVSAVEEKLELEGNQDVKAGMSVERKSRDGCKFEYGADKGCEACCKKFGLHKWNVRYDPSACKCHHLPQPPQVPENIDWEKYVPHLPRVSDEEAMMSPYRKFY